MISEWDCEQLICKHRQRLSELMECLHAEDPAQDRELWKHAVCLIAKNVDAFVETARQSSTIHGHEKKSRVSLVPESVRIKLPGHPFMHPGPSMHRSHDAWFEEWTPD